MNRSTGAHVAACALAVLALTAGLGACGQSADDKRLAQEQLDRAKAEGARQARAEQRIRDAAREARKLRRDLAKLKRQEAGKSGSKSSGGSATSSGAPVVASSGTSLCGDGLSVNSVTSCSFAENVRARWVSSGGSSMVEAFSPVTQQTYVMHCLDGGASVVCTGGNNAAVYFR